MQELTFNYAVILLPSALADGLCKLLFNWALATLRFILIKRLIQLIFNGPDCMDPDFYVWHIILILMAKAYFPCNSFNHRAKAAV